MHLFIKIIINLSNYLIMKKNYNILLLLLFLIGSFTIQGQNQPLLHLAKSSKNFHPERFQNPNSYLNTSFKTVQKKNNKTSEITDYGQVPKWLWAQQFGGSGDDYVKDIFSDTLGNIYLAGSFSGTITFGDETYKSKGDRDAFVAKFDKTHNLVWLKQFSVPEKQTAEAEGICPGPNGYLYLTGYYFVSLAAGNITLTGRKVANLFVLKLKVSTGKVIQANKYDGNDSQQYGNLPSYYGIKIISDSIGNAYVMVDVENLMFYSNTVLLKYDTLLNRTMIKEFPLGLHFSDFKIYKSALYYTGEAIVGHIVVNNNISLNPIAFCEAIVAKSDLSANFQWVSMANTSQGYNESYGLSIDVNDMGIYASGNMNIHPLVFGSDTLVPHNNNSSFVVKSSAMGNFLWAKLQSSPVTELLADTLSHKIILLSGKQLLKYDINGTIQDTIPLTHQPECLAIEKNKNLLMAGNIRGLLYLTETDDNVNQLWQALFGGNSARGWVVGMVADQKGNLYTYGYVSNKTDYFGTNLEGGMFLSKQDSHGNIIWLRQFANISAYPGIGNHLAIDTSNDFLYFAGTFSKAFKLPNGPTFTPDAAGSFVVLKYSLDGTYQNYIQENFSTNQLCLTSDYSGNLLLSGMFSNSVTIGNTTLNSAGMQDGFIAKYNPEGKILWAKRIGGENVEYVLLSSVDRHNNIYLTGEFYSRNISFNKTIYKFSEGDGDIILVKLDPQGDLKWFKMKAGSTLSYGDYYSWPTGLRVDPEGNIYMKGWHGKSTSFDDILLKSDYPYNYFVAKFDSTGNTVWANSIDEHHYGFDYNQMSIDKYGSVYLGAQIQDTIQFGNDFQYVNRGAKDLFVAKYTTVGSLDWVKTISGGGYSGISSVTVYDTNHIYVGGYFNPSISLGDTPFYAIAAHGFVALLGNDVTGVHEIYNKNNNSLHVFPDPSNGTFTINLSGNISEPVTMEVRNITGQVIYKTKFSMKHHIQINIGRQPEGVYFICIKGNAWNVTKKIIIKP